MGMNRWPKNGALDRGLKQLPAEQLVRIEAFSLDSTPVKVDPDGTGKLDVYLWPSFASCRPPSLKSHFDCFSSAGGRKETIRLQAIE